MKAKFDHDLHIHSILSSCATDVLQTGENILKYAEREGLHTICITDHFWDDAVEGASDWYKPQNYEHIEKIKPLPQSDGIRFLFGCETDMNFESVVGVSKEKYDFFDFIIIPTTHFHFVGFTVTEDDVANNENKAKAWLKRINDVLDMDLPFHKVGFAHLTTALIDRNREGLLEFIKSIDEDEMRKAFKRIAASGAGVELNTDSMNFTDENADIMLKPYRIAKECGCKFYFGSDSHAQKSFAKVRECFERSIDFLNLTEDDIFRI